ncbi:undecaprenyl/decaprenyl-phosphate alpha-N-acetylglucosaminyl 1-phosphate transferase [Pelagibacterales bacterium SAG-MED18]|nr:undecaprenyl/decaprenyl-phosphate alpha-N-acetylglucosaminyl 1-phosphate transferase [Pelagibacterales bacterium SAG-MED18]
MINILVIYSLISFLLFFICAKISYKLNFVDLPSKRKIHSKSTAYTGGIIISIIFLIALELFDLFNFSNNNLNLIISIAFLISLVGLIDDRYNLNAGGKLSLQILPIFYLVVFENLALHSIGDYNLFKLDLGAFVIPFTIICVLFLINAFNYFDGLDGHLSLVTISIITILYFLVSDQNFKFFLVIIIIPIIIFLFFNFSILKLPKLFLGDNGSLLLGFIISFILIYLASEEIVHPILLAWSIAITVYEFLSINIIRLKNNQDPFKAGLDHLHHILFKKSKSIFLTNLYIFMTNIFLFIIGYLSFFLIGPLSSLILYIICFLLFFALRYKFLKKTKINY